MTGAEPLAQSDPVTVQGLDHVFAHETPPHREAPDETGGQVGEDTVEAADGLTVAQAAVLLGFEQREVKKLIKEGKLCARRLRSTRGWIIDLECAHSWLQKLGFGPVDPGPAHAGAGTGKDEPALPSQLSEDDGVRALWYKFDLAVQQLRAASYRIGYLESQVEQYKDQVKLLPDMQAQAARAAAVEKEADDLRMRLAEARAELERQRRPWWHRWLSRAPEPGQGA